MSDGWTAVGLVNTVPPHSAVRVIVDDHDIVLWRGQDGIVRAWENRCPHRGMRLSFGRVRGNRLSCLYHGWAFDGDGGCAAIPAHPDLEPPKTIQAVWYDCREAAGMIWVSPDGAADASSLPDGSWVPCRSLHFRSEEAQSGLLESITGEDEVSGRNRIVFRPDALDTDLLLAVQPMRARGSMVHVAARADNAPGAEHLQAASRWIVHERAATESALLV